MKAILVIELDDEWLEKINTTCDEILADVTLYKKESLENQCDYSKRIYRCWCPLISAEQLSSQLSFLYLKKVYPRLIHMIMSGVEGDKE